MDTQGDASGVPTRPTPCLTPGFSRRARHGVPPRAGSTPPKPASSRCTPPFCCTSEALPRHPPSPATPPPGLGNPLI